MDSQPRRPVAPQDIITEPKQRSLSRRTLLKIGALGAASAATLGLVDGLAFLPKRVVTAATEKTGLPDIQFDIGNFIAPVQTINGLQFHFGPVFTLFVTARLSRTPTKQDQQVLNAALSAIEANYAFSPSGVFVFTAYGLPYFKRLLQQCGRQPHAAPALGPAAFCAGRGGAWPDRRFTPERENHQKNISGAGGDRVKRCPLQPAQR